MKTLDLNAYGVEEMSTSTMTNTEGGSAAVVVGLIILGMILSTQKAS